MSAGLTYEVRSTIGRGGFGEVYLAEALGSAGFSKQVALKVLNPEFAENPEVLQRLRDEARVLGLVRHRAIVQVDALLELDGRWTVVMEYVEGADLSWVLVQRRVVPLRPALEITSEVAGALNAAFHTRNSTGAPLSLIHRDVKPANIRISPFGEVKLLDFGISQAEFQAREATTQRHRYGTLMHMAPERLEGIDVAAGDVYALGTVLFHMLTGKAFGESSHRRLTHVERLAEGIRTLRRAVPDRAEVEALVSSMLAFDPEERPTAREVERRCAAQLGDAGEPTLRDWAEATIATVVQPPLTGDDTSMATGALTGTLAGDATRGWIRDEPTPAPERAQRRPPSPSKSSSESGQIAGLGGELTRFVGRTAELDAIARLVRQGSSLITLVGTAGSGKSRLARQYARSESRQSPGDTWFCDLTDAASLDGMCHALAAVLDLRLASEDPVKQLGQAMNTSGQGLIVLDGFEHLVEHAPATLGHWLAAAPGITFIVTSRERLLLRGEQVVPVEPLPLPAAGERDPDVVGSSASVMLFVARAQAVDPDFELSRHNAADVARLVQLLDGLPLAIELAAARVRVLPPGRMLSRLARRFDVLRGLRRDQSGRQSTLRGAIDWSWGLLEPWEQTALAQCSVFQGGFTLEAAEAVLDLDPWPDAPWPMDVVQTLLDKSLLRTIAKEADDSAPSTAFGMLGSIHEYASEKLATHGAACLPDGSSATGEQARADIERRHALWFAQHGTDDALRALNAHGGLARRRRLEADLENVVAACRRSTLAGDADLAAKLWLAAWQVLRLRGPYIACLELSDPILDMPELDRRLRGWMIRNRAWLMEFVGRVDESKSGLSEAIEVAREVGDPRLESIATSDLAYYIFYGNTGEEAVAMFERAAELARKASDLWIEGLAANGLGELHRRFGRPDAALAAYEHFLHLARENGDKRGEGIALLNLGELARENRDWAVSQAHYEQGLAAVRKVGDKRIEGAAIGLLADIERAQGDLDKALTHCLDGLELIRQTGDWRCEAETLLVLARTRLDLGSHAEAREAADSAEAIFTRHGQRFDVGLALAVRVLVDAARGRRSEASDALDQAERLLAELEDGSETKLSRAIAEARAALGG